MRLAVELPEMAETDAIFGGMRALKLQREGKSAGSRESCSRALTPWLQSVGSISCWQWQYSQVLGQEQSRGLRRSGAG